MGRPNILQEKHLTLDKIVKAYRMFGSEVKAAKALGISKWSVSVYVRKAGVSPVKHQKQRHRPSPKRYRHTSQFAEWLREHPDVRLPKSVPEIARITGISYNTVKCYLWRRRQRKKSLFKRWVKDHKDTIKQGRFYANMWDVHRFWIYLILHDGRNIRGWFNNIKELEEFYNGKIR